MGKHSLYADTIPPCIRDLDILSFLIIVNQGSRGALCSYSFLGKVGVEAGRKQLLELQFESFTLKAAG